MICVNFQIQYLFTHISNCLTNRILVKLGGPAHGIVTKTVHKTWQRGGRSQRAMGGSMGLGVMGPRGRVWDGMGHGARVQGWLGQGGRV